MTHRRKYIEYLIRRLNRVVRDVEFYLLVPSEDDKLKESLDKLASEVNEIKKQTEDYD